jgi:capsular polysaccharide biosynthesis protein
VHLREYAGAVVRRWAWVLIGGLLGLLLCGIPGYLSHPGYRSSVSLYVGAATVDGPEDPAYASLIPTDVLPSIAALGNSTTVTARVAATLHLSVSPAELADSVTAAVQKDTGVLTLSVTSSTPGRAGAVAGAMGAQVQQEAMRLYATGGRSMLSVAVLGHPSPAVSAATAGPAKLAAAGAALGGVVAAIACGFAEARRPRIRGRRDVAGISGLPVLSLPTRPRRDVGRRLTRARRVDARAEELVRLRWLLRSWLDEALHCRVAVTGSVPPGALAALARELATADLEVIPVASPARLAAIGPVDGVLVMADSTATTPQELSDVLDECSRAGSPLAAVLIDGLLAPGAGWRARLRAGLRGDGRWSREARGSDGEHAADSDRWITRAVASAAVAAVGFTLPLTFALSTGLLAAIALLPVWSPLARRHRGARFLFGLAVVALVDGVLLTWLSSVDHVFAQHEAVRAAALVLTSICGIGLILWARTALPIPVIGIAFGVGNLVAGLGSLGIDNPWKFVLSFPVSVIVLSVVALRPTPLRTVAALSLLGVVDVANDYRSAFGFSAVAAALVLWQARRTPGSGRQPRWWIVVPGFAGLAAAGYWVMVQLLLSGALGAQIQQRSAVQIAQSGSLILGGRPEWTATWALMRSNPLGFGLGTVPNAQDTLVAKAGLAVTHIPTVDDYLEHQLLSSSFELHSIIADLWAVVGPLGVLLGVAMAALGVHGLAFSVGRRTASGLVCWLIPMALWDLAFGPLQDNQPTLTLALGLLLVVRESRPGRGRPSAGADHVPAAAEHERAPVEARAAVAG